MARTITARTSCAGDKCPQVSREAGTTYVIGYLPGMPQTPENEVEVAMPDATFDQLHAEHGRYLGR